ncbi:hypothetical protein [Aliagarivorans taiwanensis]|uniref:hypothetical protein n=1 Tax=Aliagarivorans taiwanensis TaxID=561966 RepID=UPI0003FA516A|nr:hypothetical protein [Aliagarivorans taiwanensis]
MRVATITISSIDFNNETQAVEQFIDEYADKTFEVIGKQAVILSEQAECNSRLDTGDFEKELLGMLDRFIKGEVSVKSVFDICEGSASLNVELQGEPGFLLVVW